MMRSALARQVPWLFFCLVILYGHGCGPHVVESSQPLRVENLPDNIKLPLSGSWPEDARDIQFAISSLSLRGQLYAYTVKAPIDQLRDHARQEFAALKQVPVERELEYESVTVDEVKRWKRNYRVNLDWFKPNSIKEGILYKTEDTEEASRTMWIWLDYERSQLYLLIVN